MGCTGFMTFPAKTPNTCFSNSTHYCDLATVLAQLGVRVNTSPSRFMPLGLLTGKFLFGAKTCLSRVGGQNVETHYEISYIPSE